MTTRAMKTRQKLKNHSDIAGVDTGFLKGGWDTQGGGAVRFEPQDCAQKASGNIADSFSTFLQSYKTSTPPEYY